MNRIVADAGGRRTAAVRAARADLVRASEVAQLWRERTGVRAAGGGVPMSYGGEPQGPEELAVRSRGRVAINISHIAEKYPFDNNVFTDDVEDAIFNS